MGGVLGRRSADALRLDGHKVDTEDPNLFLRLLREHHSDVWAKAFREQYVVCIPQSVSLRHRVRREDIENHVLRCSHVDGDYTTLNGKRVGFTGAELVTKQGFERARRVRIICTEELAEDCAPGGGGGGGGGEGEGTNGSEGGPRAPSSVAAAPRTLSVLHITRPLDGGVEAPENLDEFDRPALTRYLAMLRAYPENESLFTDLDRFVRRFEFSAARGELARVRPSLEARLRQQWHATTLALLEAGSFREAAALQRPRGTAAERRQQRERCRARHLGQIQQAVEAYLLEGVHEPLVSFVRQQHAPRDAQLRRAMHRLRHCTQQDLHIAPAFQAELRESVALLGSLSALPTPLQKLMCVKGVLDLTSRAIEAALAAHHRDKGAYALATDDLLDSLVYVVLQARRRLPDLYTQLTLMKRFHFRNISSTVLGFNLANFEVAVGWLVGRGAEMEAEAGAGAGAEGAAGAEAGDAAREQQRRYFASAGAVADAAAPAPPLGTAGAEPSPDPDMDAHSAGGQSRGPVVPSVVVARDANVAAAERFADVAALAADAGTAADAPGMETVALASPGSRRTSSVTSRASFASRASVVAEEEEEGGGGMAAQDQRRDAGAACRVVVCGCRRRGEPRTSEVALAAAAGSAGIGAQARARARVLLACGQQFFCAVDAAGAPRTWGLPECGCLGYSSAGGAAAAGAGAGADAPAPRPMAAWERLRVERSDSAASDVSCSPPSGAGTQTDTGADTADECDCASSSPPPPLPPPMLASPPRAGGGAAAVALHAAAGASTTAPMGATAAAAPAKRGSEGSDNPAAQPRVVAPLGPPQRRVVAVSCGAYHTLAVVGAQHRLWAWGDNSSGQLGLGRKYAHFDAPCDVPALRGYFVHAAAAGGQHSLAIATFRGAADGGQRAQGTARLLYSWGRAACGRLGRAAGPGGNYLPGVVDAAWGRLTAEALAELPDHAAGGAAARAEMAPEPDEGGTRARAADAVVAVSAGWAHSLAVTRAGVVFAWGNGECGRLGLGSHADADRPQVLLALLALPLRVSAVAAGYAHSLMLTRGGMLLACGLNRFGQLGGCHEDDDYRGGAERDNEGGPSEDEDKDGGGDEDGDEDGDDDGDEDGASQAARPVPTPTVPPQCAARDARRRRRLQRLVPRPVPSLSRTRVVAAGCGDYHSYAVAADGRALVWGLNKRGQCGLPVLAPRREGARTGSARNGSTCGGGAQRGVIEEPVELQLARCAKSIAAGGHYLAVATAEAASADNE